jgi:hypothetical protein
MNSSPSTHRDSCQRDLSWTREHIRSIATLFFKQCLIFKTISNRPEMFSVLKIRTVNESAIRFRSRNMPGITRALLLNAYRSNIISFNVVWNSRVILVCDKIVTHFRLEHSGTRPCGTVRARQRPILPSRPSLFPS